MEPSESGSAVGKASAEGKGIETRWDPVKASFKASLELYAKVSFGLFLPFYGINSNILFREFMFTSVQFFFIYLNNNNFFWDKNILIEITKLRRCAHIHSPPPYKSRIFLLLQSF